MADKPIPMTASEFRATLNALGLSAEDGDILLRSRGNMYAYKSGATAVPAHLAALLRIMRDERRKPADVMARCWR